MRIFELDGRLSVCADFVRHDSRLADIGTDHALLPVWLLLNNKIKSAVACDINELPLNSGRECVEKYSLTDKVDLRLSDGLTNVKEDEADDIVIAGMGGELIVKILDDCKWIKSTDKHLILQPMTKYEKLTEYLYNNGFEIDCQKACYADKKYYTVMSVYYTGNNTEYEYSDLFIGKLDTDYECSKAFLNSTVNHLKKRALGDKTLNKTIEKIEAVIK